MKKICTPFESPLLRFSLKTVAGQNGKPGILGKTRIGVREFAEIEDGAV